MAGERLLRPQLRSGVAHIGSRTVLVAGGAGFIGSNLCARLISAGDRVICLDNLETGRCENISDLLANPNFVFIRHDILNPLEIESKIDRIYNLACPGSPPKYQLDPIHTFKTSVIGAINLLDLAQKKNARILQSSTSEVYGDPDVSPLPEDYRGLVNTVGPRACYDEGKRGAETLFYEMHRCEGIDSRIARIFNTYGPKMDPKDGRVISNFVVQACSGADLTIYGDGSQTRSFCYIDDMLDALTRLMETTEPSETIFDPVNLGNPGEFTVSDLAQIILDMTGSDSRIIYCDLPQDDPRQRRPDITHARNMLGWEPKVALREGLLPTIEYFRDALENQQLLGDHVA